MRIRSSARGAALVVLALLCLAVSSCSSNPKSLIQGRWQKSDGGKVVAEFDDAFATLTEKRGDAIGDVIHTYQWVDDKTIDIAAVGKVTVAVTRQELTLTFPDGRVEKLTRAK